MCLDRKDEIIVIARALVESGRMRRGANDDAQESARPFPESCADGGQTAGVADDGCFLARTDCGNTNEFRAAGIRTGRGRLTRRENPIVDYSIGTSFAIFHATPG